MTEFQEGQSKFWKLKSSSVQNRPGPRNFFTCDPRWRLATVRFPSCPRSLQDIGPRWSPTQGGGCELSAPRACNVLADAGFGLSAPCRQGLTTRGLAWAVGILRHLKVYPAAVLIWPVAGRGPSPQAAHSGHPVEGGRRHAGQRQVAECELAKRHQGVGWKLASPRFACGSPMDRRSKSRTWFSSTFQETKRGSW